MTGIVEIRPKTASLQPWQGESVENSVMQPLRLRAQLGPDLRYRVALSADRLKELSERTGYDLSLSGDPDDPHPFWDESKVARVILKNKTNIFDLSNPAHEIQFAIAKSHDFVALDLEDATNRPETKFVIYSQEEAATKKAGKVKLTQDAMIMVSKLNKPTKIKLLMILTGTYHNNSSNDVIDVATHEQAVSNPKEFLRWAEATKEEIAIRVLLLNSIEEGFISKSGGRIMFGDVELGLTLDDAVATLMKPDSIDIQVRLKEKLEAVGKV